MTTIIEHLARNREPYPDWLRAGPRAFNRSDFFGSRTIYYPGSGDDGQPVKLCAKAHAAHAFVYVDTAYDRVWFSERLYGSEPGFRGYAPGCPEPLREADLRPGGWTPHASRSQAPEKRYAFATADPFAWFVVFRRKDSEGYGDEHGPKRVAGLFICADGFAAYDALYCQSDGTPAPFLVTVQDHGYGGNWNKFGRGGLLEEIACTCSALPDRLLVGEMEAKFEPWRGYRDTGAPAEPGGAHAIPRRLFFRDADTDDAAAR